MTRAILAVLLLAAAGCNPLLTAQSAAPPGRTARLDEVHGVFTVKSYRMELSQGIALAFTCTRGTPCEKMTVVSDNPAIAEVRRASLGRLERAGFANQATSAAVVVVGKAPGTTRIHVRAKQGSREIAVTVVAPPGPIAAQATAAK